MWSDGAIRCSRKEAHAQNQKKVGKDASEKRGLDQSELIWKLET